jgi:GT2 family glycosyltransferase
MTLSIVILTWNSSRHIEDCLNSLLSTIGEPLKPFEIFVVDNGSTDRTRAILSRYQTDFPEVIKPIFLDANTGTTYSRNLALRKAAGSYIAILDSDVIIPGDIFTPLVAFLDGSSRTGMVVPRLLYGNGAYQKSTDNFPTLPSKARRYLFLKGMEKRELQPAQVPQCVDYAISAFWLLKKEVVAQVGLLDEKIFYAPEDVDYCLRVWRKGYRIVYLPDVEVIHNAQEISRGFRINRAFIAHLTGLLYFFRKHGYWLKKPCFVDHEEN